ncbi:glycoside hydrolase family 5 protein [Tortispora caseinolytica NRRL Y-17796]|uniref:Glycoside hydrolase family 5 protein n=1 Tax=Tortispora caseinolytica NRRL Y-17796 TaxID=767744 RepID=A0A1E4TGI5_9ASCO|nr:glycoside hydrolase family 5 protein [Tortispora caseinolytica NRRL Y-17796]
MKVLKKILKKNESKTVHASSASSANVQLADPDNIPAWEMVANRYQFGVNIGSWFCLERWLTGSMYVGNGDSELDAVTGAVQILGTDKAKKKFEDHWRGFMSGEDWQWLADNGFNSVRVPFGYWTLGGDYLSATPFEPYKEVYANAWSIYKRCVIERAADYGISVLVDLHGVYGGANGDIHSGTSSGTAAFYSNSSMCRTIESLGFIAEELKPYVSRGYIAGLQVINEPQYGKSLESFYDQCLQRIHGIDSTLQVVIADSWDPQRYRGFAQNRINVTVDTHYYRTFSDDDHKLSPQAIIDSTGIDADTDVIVGEYSCVMDENTTWKRVDAGQRQNLVNAFGQKQFDVFRRSTAGSYFWTYRMDWMPGGEWGIKQMVMQGAIPSARQPDSKVSDTSRTAKCQEMLATHANYWNQTSPGESMEHWRFEKGFMRGWSDAAAYWKFNKSVIGNRRRYRLDRLSRHVGECGTSKYLWEFEHGYNQGREALEKSLNAI